MVSSSLTRGHHIRTLAYVSLCVLAYFISNSLLSAYTGGDQVYYRALYAALGRESISEIPLLLLRYVSSNEVLTGFVLWIGASLGVDKNVYISVLNVLLILGVVRFIVQSGANLLVIILVLSNFYLLVLLTSAERLKISYLLLVWAVLFQGRIGLLMALISPMAHLQSIIFLFGIASSFFGSWFVQVAKTLRIKKSVIIGIVLPTIVTIIIVTFFFDGILRKGVGYTSVGGGAVEIFNSMLLFVSSMAFAKSRIKYIAALVPMIVAAYLIGGARINMIAFTLVFYIAALEHRLNHPVFIGLLIYFSYKSIFFVLNIYQFGHGFA